MDYYKKYLKYKSKYEKLKGGVLVFNEDGLDYKLLKTKMVSNNLNYEDINSRANSFNKNQKDSIEKMVNFVLPHLEFNGKKLNYEFIKDVSAIGAGTFGVTIANENLLIKIFKKSAIAIEEINALEDLFHNPDLTLKPNSSINKYYGFMAGKNIPELRRYNDFDDPTLNLNSNLFILNRPLFKFNNAEFDAKIAAISNVSLTDYLTNTIGNDLIFAFFEKATGDLNDFIEDVVPRLDNIQKVKMAGLLFSQIKLGFDFLHKTRHLAHYDIKSANLVYKSNDDGTINFQIIDFGGLTPIDNDGYGRINVHTPYYRRGSRYQDPANNTYMYDYYCLIFVVLAILGFKDLNPASLNRIYDIIRNEWTRNPDDDINKRTDDVITVLNTTVAGLDLPTGDRDPDLYANYKVIIVWTLFACGFNGNVLLGNIDTI